MDKQMIEEMTKLMANWAVQNGMLWHEGHAQALAEVLLEEYQPKIPEGAVVLTREEYEELKKGIKTYNYTAMFDAQSAYRWEQGYLQGAKEAAEKFAEKIFELFPEDKNLTYIHRRTVDKICKGITEGK